MYVKIEKYNQSVKLSEIIFQTKCTVHVHIEVNSTSDAKYWDDGFHSRLESHKLQDQVPKHNFHNAII